MRVNPIYASFTSGELSPLLDGRVDLDNYRRGCKALENMTVWPHGGVTKRPGTRFISEVKTSSKSTRLIPFIYSEDQAYILELGDQYLRFYANGGQIISVPTATKLYLPFDGVDGATSTTDEGSTVHTMTMNADAQIDTSHRKFGTASLLLDGTGDYVSAPDHADWNMGSGTVTVDCWVRLSAIGAAHGLWGQNSGGNDPRVMCWIDATNFINFEVYDGGTVVTMTTANALAANTWYHIAVVRGWGGNANDWAITVDGAAQATVTDSSSWTNNSGTWDIGKAYDGSSDQYLNGRIDEFRVSKASALWTADFTPPTSAAPISQSGTAYEIATPWIEGHLSEVKFVQSADTMYLVHPDYAPRKLTRTLHNSWTLATPTFTYGPFLDENTTAVTMDADGVTGSVTIDSSSAFFNDPGHIGAVIRMRGTLPRETAISAQNTFTSTLELEAGQLLQLEISGTWAGTVTLMHSYDDGASYTPHATFTANDTAEYTADEDGILFKLGFRTGEYTSGTATCTIYKPDHIGYATITAVSSTTQVTATVVQELPHVSATKLWSEGAWSTYRGYPGTVTFWEQRLVFGGNAHRPLTLWASQVDDYENMKRGVNDSDAWIYTLAGAKINQIRWMIDADVLLVGTVGGEWKFGYVDTPTTPTNVTAKNLKTNYGSSNVMPVMIAKTILFLQQQAKKLRTISYNADLDNYSAPEISLRAEHLFDSVMVDMAVVEEPRPILWLVRSDGRLIGCTYDPENQVVAFHKHFTTDGTSESDFESIAVIPGSDRDVAYVVVKRTINGSVVRHVEYFATTEWDTVQDSVYADDALTGSAQKENLLDYTEVDGPGRVALTNNTVTITDLDEDEEVYVYKDYGVDNFDGDYKFEFQLNVSKMTVNQGAYAWALTNVLDDLKAISGASGDYEALQIFNFSGQLALLLEFSIAGTVNNSSSVNITAGTDYYITIARDDDAGIDGDGKIYLHVFSDAARTTHITGSPVRLGANATDFRYLHAMNTNKDGTTGSEFSAVITDLKKGYTAISGLSHLEGETVKVLGDGITQTDQTVSSGAITASAPAMKFTVGLGFTSKMTTPRLEAGAKAGTAQGRLKAINEVTVRMHESYELDVGVKETDLTSVDFDTARTQPSWPDITIPFVYGESFSGDKQTALKSSSGRVGRITVQSGDPTPFGIIAIIPQLTTEEY